MRLALVVATGQEPMLPEAFELFRGAESLAGPLDILLISDGPAPDDLLRLLAAHGLRGQVHGPSDEALGVEEAEARLADERGHTLLLRLSHLPALKALTDALARLEEDRLAPQDWHPSHRALPPMLYGYSLGLVHCSQCKALLRSERGVATSSRTRSACPGKPG